MIGLALVHKNGIHWKSMVHRVLRIGGWALVITTITYLLFPRHYVFFGILHCIAVSSIVGLLFVKRPILALGLGIFLILSNLLYQTTLLPLGTWLKVTPMDYVPFYPWFGLVLLGIFLESIHFHKIPINRIPAVRTLEALGKHSLMIYLLHRPILFGGVFLIHRLLHSPPHP